MHVICPVCLAANRVPAERLGDRPVCGKCRAALLAGEPLALAGVDFQRYAAGSELPVLVDFWAPWCGPCRAMAPALEAVARRRADLHVVKLDTDADPATAAQYRIRRDAGGAARDLDRCDAAACVGAGGSMSRAASTRPAAWRGAWLLAAALGATALSAGELTLSAAWQAAEQHDPAFAAERAQWEAGRTQAEQARALWLPSLAAVGSAGRGNQETETRGAAFAAPGFGSTTGVDFRSSVTGGTATRWALTAEQPLFDAGRLASARELRTGARAADEQYRAARQELILRTARSYFGVLDARAQVEALERLRAAAERTRATAQARYDAGELPVTDMREAQATADAIGVQQLDARNVLILAEAAFRDLTGLDPAAIAGVQPAAGSEPPAPESLDTWTRRALAGSPQLALQRLAQQRAAAEVGRYGLFLSPRISVVAQAGRESLRGDGDFGSANVTGRQASVALQASVPLFTGGMRSAQRHEARALERRASAELDGATQQIEQRARAAWLGLGTAAARVQALRRLQDSAATRLDATRLGVETGGRTTLELLGAEGDYLRTVADLRRAQTQWLLAGMELAAVAGELDGGEVATVDRQLLAAAGTAQPQP